jgi:hypothetical protein
MAITWTRSTHDPGPERMMLGAGLRVTLGTARCALLVESGEQPEGVGHAGMLQGTLD